MMRPTRSQVSIGSRIFVTSMLLAFGCGGGGSSIGPEGGTVVSDDGKMKLVIPPGALSSPASIKITKTDSGFPADAALLAGSTYQIDAPELTLAIPGQLIYELGTLPAPTTMSVPGLGTQHQAVDGACITLIGAVCKVELGTGSCPILFPNFVGLESIPWATTLNPFATKWVLDCEGPPSFPSPSLTLIVPDGLNLGGLFNMQTGQLTANLSVLHQAIAGVLLDNPTLAVSIDKAQIHPSDSFQLTAVETGSTHFAKVEFYDVGGTATDGSGNTNNGMSVTANTKVGEAAAAPYTAAVSVTGLSVGKRIYEARALDANGTVIVTGQATVDIVPTGALTVSLAASSTNITIAGATTLTATPSGGAAISKVEFFEGSTKLGETTSGPYTFDVAYTSASNGAHTYHAVATDTAAATASSNDVNVIVNIAIVGPSYYVDAAAGVDTKPCTSMAPCKTIGFAASGAPLGTTVFLADGTYAAATQTASVALPDGVTLKATNAGMATVTGVAFTFAGGGGLDGLVVGTGASFTAASATGTPLLALTGVLWKTLGGLSLGGNVHATMSPGALAGGIYTSALPLGGNFILMNGASQLLIQGGIIDGNNNGDATTGGGFILATGASHLTLDAVTLRNRSSEVISAAGAAPASPVVVTLQNGTVFDTIGGLATPSGGIVVRVGTNTTLNVSNTTVKNCAGATAFGTYYNFDHTTVSIGAGTVVKDGAGGLSGGNTGVASSVTIAGASFTNLTNRAIVLNGATSLDVSASTFSGNNRDIELVSLSSVKLRTSTFTSTNNQPHIILNEVAAADLGTGASLGGNTFSNTMNSALFANTASTMTVNAVGNTWNLSQQGADAAGHYTTGTTKNAPESGLNFQIVTGVTLNL